MENKKKFRLVESTLKGKVIKETNISLKPNVTDIEVEELFLAIGPVINCKHEGSYISDTYLFYETIDIKSHNILSSFL